uniref:NADH dehydrogenase subunit 6 n=1 Tax=Donax trunculus TaxID=40130 RepID=A0A250E5T7_9BIVA|nr:NADH dehydrogenase subunit 6 [Donax trunculus]ATA66393.1 NADH dehydrogenase subunit 6 [Donax trunculus]
MSNLMLFMFWGGYMLVLFSLLMWSAKHPLMVGSLILLSYMFGSLLVSFNISFVMGIFLFLTGVSGMMVAFLYVVALCPNPVFKGLSVSMSFMMYLVAWVVVGATIPALIMFSEVSFSYGLEAESLSESVECLRDPCMFGGLASLMPLLGAILFLCMVSVVSLCVQQKQCLGGHDMLGGSQSSVTFKRLYN